jgi:ATP-dependent Clp protease ATP-binding subunit ClpA
VVEKGYNLAFGARFLKRYIDEHIQLPISSRWKEGAHFSVRARDGRSSSSRRRRSWSATRFATATSRE